MDVPFSPKLIELVRQKFHTTELAGCGSFACAWHTTSGRICKLTEHRGDAEMALRRAEFTENGDDSLDDVLVIIDAVYKFKYNNTTCPEWVTQDPWVAPDNKQILIEDTNIVKYIIISEPLIPIQTLYNRQLIFDLLEADTIAPGLKIKDNTLLALAIEITFNWTESYFHSSPELLNADAEALMDLIRIERDLPKCIPDNFLLIAIDKFRALYAANRLLIESQETQDVSLTWDAHSGNWGLRNPDDLESLVLFDFGGGWPHRKKLPNLEYFNF